MIYTKIKSIFEKYHLIMYTTSLSHASFVKRLFSSTRSGCPLMGRAMLTSHDIIDQGTKNNKKSCLLNIALLAKDLGVNIQVGLHINSCKRKQNTRTVTHSRHRTCGSLVSEVQQLATNNMPKILELNPRRSISGCM